jgi:hypothetical protein
MRAGRAVAGSAVFAIEGGATAHVDLLCVGSGGAIELTLDGIPVAELASLRLALDRRACSTEELALEGERFVARGVAPGTWILRLRNSAWSVADAEVELRPGETLRLELAAEPGREVSVTCAVA